MKVEVLKQLQSLLPFNPETFRPFVEAHVEGMANAAQKVQTVVEEVELTIFNGMNVTQLLESTILVAAQNIQNDIEYDKLATRFLLTSIYKDTLKIEAGDTDFKEVYKRNFINYIKKGIDLKLLNPELTTTFNVAELADNLNPALDEDYLYIGLSTVETRYAMRDRDQVLLETPQFMWMRIAMGLSLKEPEANVFAKRFYAKLSTKEYIPGGSTNIAAGTTFSVLSNCYLMETQDDIDSIYDNIKNIAKISKATGGIGISVTKLRAAGSEVKSNNTMSTGPIPFIKVMDAALKSMSRAGKKYGAMCIYMENWHINFPEFVDLKQNNGDDYRRIRTADTAVYISDEFMKRVVNGEDWFMFNPAETPDLCELYGQEFSKRYNEYVEMAKRGELKMFDVTPAREQMKKILQSMLSNSHPWLTWKDTINVRALNNNTGTIHNSNLCTEICLPQDRENIAVCNLAYINIIPHINVNGTNPDTSVDWEKLEDTVRVLMRHLDNLVEVNMSPLPETKRSDDNNRAVGMGMSGFSEALEKLGLPYDSPQAYELMDKISEFISYVSIDESCNLAEERGSYPNFEGSMWSKGYVPYDTVEKLAKERLGLVWDGEIIDAANSSNTQTEKSGVTETLESIRGKIQTGLQKATTEESKDLYALFDQISNILQSTVSKDQQEEVSVSMTLNNQSKSVIDEVFPNSAGRGIALRQNKRTSMDWNRLRSRVKKGIRNATTMAIAPNASTGLVLGTSPGIDPRFAQIFSRTTYSGKFLDINHNLVHDLQKLGIWEKVKDKVLEKYGDISEIEEIPQNLKDVYKTCFQISPYAFIEVASRAQKWIDQAMSRNMYLDTRDVDEMVEIYTEAWRRGLKTTYYLHTKPRHKAEQSTVKVNKRESLNKSGFGAASSHTAQPSIDGKTEKKGFGFASKPTDQAEQTIKVESNSSSGRSQGFGFSSAPKRSEQKDSVSESLSLKPVAKKVTDFAACPIDPAERAMCEACQ